MFIFLHRFQATGDHLPVAPPAPPQPIPQQVQPQYQPSGNANYAKDPYDTSDQFDDGSYDERWNNPGFRGDGRSQAPVQAAPVRQQNYNVPAANYNYQNQQPAHNPAPVAPVVRQQNYNVPAQNYLETTPSPHRFFPPGKLNLNRTPDGFSFQFNKQ